MNGNWSKYLRRDYKYLKWNKVGEIGRDLRLISEQKSFFLQSCPYFLNTSQAELLAPLCGCHQKPFLYNIEIPSHYNTLSTSLQVVRLPHNKQVKVAAISRGNKFLCCVCHPTYHSDYFQHQTFLWSSEKEKRDQINSKYFKLKASKALHLRFWPIILIH